MDLHSVTVDGCYVNAASDLTMLQCSGAIDSSFSYTKLQL